MRATTSARWEAFLAFSGTAKGIRHATLSPTDLAFDFDASRLA
jgi:hypothetical protein